MLHPNRDRQIAEREVAVDGDLRCSAADRARPGGSARITSASDAIARVRSGERTARRNRSSDSRKRLPAPSPFSMPLTVGPNRLCLKGRNVYADCAGTEEASARGCHGAAGQTQGCASRSVALTRYEGEPMADFSDDRKVSAVREVLRLI